MMLRARWPHPFLFVCGLVFIAMGVTAVDGVSLMLGGALTWWSIGP